MSFDYTLFQKFIKPFLIFRVLMNLFQNDRYFNIARFTMVMGCSLRFHYILPSDNYIFKCYQLEDNHDKYNDQIKCYILINRSQFYINNSW